MRYQQEGEDEVNLKTEFSVTKADDNEIVLELFGGSSGGEYYTLTKQEAWNLFQGLKERLNEVVGIPAPKIPVLGEDE